MAGDIPEGEKSYLMTLALASLLGMFGADRFYLGKTRTAVFKLLTLGGFGFWWLADIAVTLFGGARDRWGLKLQGYRRHRYGAWIFFGLIIGWNVIMNSLGIADKSLLTEGGGLTTLGWATLGGAALGFGIWRLKKRRR